MQAVLFLTFKSHTGTAHFGHSEGVVGLDAQHLLDAAALFVGMGFGSDDQGTQAGIPAGIDAHFFHHFIQASGIARNGMQGRCAEIGDELDLPFGVSGSSRNGEHAQRSAPYWKPRPPVNMP